MKLLIVESPSKTKTITKYLGKGYSVVASVGHVRDLPKSNKDAVDIENDFTPRYVVSPKKKDVLKDIATKAKKADEILLATDPDREGEAIAWHILEELHDTYKIPEEKFKRVTFNEITEEAVKDALEHPRDIDDNLRKAQEARRVLDRLVGYDLSGLIWKKVRYGLSAGRVQSPALRLIMELEREIRAFIPEAYFTITADVETKKAEALTLNCSEEPRERAVVDTILKAGEKETWVITDIDEKSVKRNPYAPFKTSTLQQAASSRLGFSPSRTMRVAQKLYEAGLITYMRTDSTNLSQGALGNIARVIEENYGKKYLQTKQYATKSKNAQEAHEAIRPTHVAKKSISSLTEEQSKLYTLIYTRTISSQMKPAELIRTKVIVSVGGADIPTFSVNGSQTKFDGWLKADPRARGEDVELPPLTINDELTLKELHVEEKETQPPSRYSEARLVKELEKRGIGRPSTYASIIKTLIDRGYVIKEGRALKPTDTGDVVSGFLEKEFSEYISDTFTADMEDELDDIAGGKRDYAKTLKDFYTPFTKQIESKEDIPKLTDLGPAPEGMLCPDCKASMVRKLGRSGTFYSCSTFPDCKGARTLDGEEIGAEEPIGKHPETEKDIFVKNGPYGPYVEMEVEGKKKPKRASIPEDTQPDEVTVDIAVKLLSLPRTLGTHPETQEEIVANIGRFGPYIALMKKPKPDYRSLKEDDPYTITLERALEILKEPKKRRGGKKKKS